MRESYLQHGEDVVVPEAAVCRVDLWDVAEQLLAVNLAQNQTVLQVAQTVEEQLDAMQN